MGWDTTTFLRQFKSQRDGEVTEEWRRNYADAEALVNVCKGVRGGGEGLPLQFEPVWKDAYLKPCKAFLETLNELREHWGPLEETLTKCEKEGVKADIGMSKTTVKVLSKCVEEHYRSLLKLQVFQYWHRVLYDYALDLVEKPWCRNTIIRAPWWEAGTREWRDPKVLVRIMEDVVARYAAFRSKMNCDLAGVPRSSKAHHLSEEEAEALLSMRRMDVSITNMEVWWTGLSCGVLIPLSIILLYVTAAPAVPTFDYDRDLWEIFPLFRGFLIVYVAMLAWAFVLHNMNKRRVNYPFILGLTGATIGPLHVVQMAAVLLAVWLACFTLYLAEAKCAMSFFPIPREVYVILNIAVPLVVFLWPFPGFLYNSRRWLWRNLAYILCTPMFSVTFAHNFLTDFLTSLVKPLVDFSITGCAFITGAAWGAADMGTCTGMTTVPSVVTLLPLTWRLMQCLRKAVSPMFRAIKDGLPGNNDDTERDDEEERGGREGHHLLGKWEVQGTSSHMVFTRGDKDTIEMQLAREHAVVRGVSKGDPYEFRRYKYAAPVMKWRTGEVSSQIVFLRDAPLAMDALEVAWHDKETGETTRALATRVLRTRANGVVWWPHMANAMKYVCSILPVTIGLAHPDWKHQSAHWPVGRVVYVVLLVVSTIYSFLWDIFMDWGLWRQRTFPPGRLKDCLCGLMWRETSLQLGLMAKTTYVLLVIFDLVGRFAWSFTLIATTSFVGVSSLGNGMVLVLVTSLFEVCRRSVWARLRLGNEHHTDVGQYRSGDGYRTVPPLMTKTTPWTVPGQYAVLRTLEPSPTGQKKIFLSELPSPPSPPPTRGWFS